MKKIFAILSLALLAGCTSQTTDKFAVYLSDTNEEVFSEDDLVSYDYSSSTFTFTPEGAEKMKAYQTSLKIDAGLYQKSFVAKLGEEEMYTGKFWTGLSSMSESGIVITDVVMVSPEYNTLTVSAGYPSSESNDEINSDKLIQHFLEANKLIDTESGYATGEYTFENENEGYSLLLPADYELALGMSDGYLNPKVEGGFPSIKLNFLPSSKDDPTGEDILKDEKDYMEILCGQTDACGEIIESDSVELGSKTALKFTVRHEGRAQDDRGRTIDEYHYSIAVPNPYYSTELSENEPVTIILHFSISTTDLDSQAELEKAFDEIMKTISFKQ